MDSIGEVRQYKDNLVLTRLVLALAVIWCHAFPFSIGAKDPTELATGFDTGWWAVNGFIAISGYCILQSRERSRSGAHFLWKRFLRVYPPYAVCMAILLAAYAVTAINWFDLLTFGPVMGGPVPRLQLNLPMWTVRIEECIYLAVAAIFAIRLANKGTAILFFVLCYVGNYWRLTHLGPGEVPDTIFDGFIRLIPYFCAGALLHQLKVPFRIPWMIGAAVVLVVGAVFQQGALVGPICLPYLVLGLGLTPELAKIPDLSYGVYLWGWPVMVWLAYVAFPRGWSPLTLFLGTALLCLLIAFLTHVLIEKPLRRYRDLGKKPAPLPEQPPPYTLAAPE